jgi:hypothetical protein
MYVWQLCGSRPCSCRCIYQYLWRCDAPRCALHLRNRVAPAFFQTAAAACQSEAQPVVLHGPFLAAPARLQHILLSYVLSAKHCRHMRPPCLHMHQSVMMVQACSVCTDVTHVSACILGCCCGNLRLQVHCALHLYLQCRNALKNATFHDVLHAQYGGYVGGYFVSQGGQRGGKAASRYVAFVVLRVVLAGLCRTAYFCNSRQPAAALHEAASLLACCVCSGGRRV